MSKRKRESIDLKTKYDILKDIECGVDYNLIQQKFNLKNKSNISAILSNKEKIINAFESGQSKNQSKSLKTSQYPDIDEAVLKWFTVARESKISLSNTIIKEQALEFAKNLGFSDFTARNGWLRNFRIRHNIVYGVVSGEAASVDKAVVKEWTERLPEIIRGKLMICKSVLLNHI